MRRLAVTAGPPAHLLCFLSARNLGDAVVHAGFFRSLVDAGYAERYVVWTFAQAAFLYDGIERCTVVVSRFPTGAAAKGFFTGGVRSFLAAVLRIRGMQPSHTLELVADVRERWACRLLGARVNLSPAWAPGHPFRSQNRMGRFVPSSLLTVPAHTRSMYDAYEQLLSAMLGTRHRPIAPALDWRPLQAKLRSGRPVRVGIHPFASRPCKLWPTAHWVGLAAAWRQQIGSQTTWVLFGAPADADLLEPLQKSLADGPVEVLTSSLAGFAENLHGVDLLIGLDSFAVHLANRQSVPSVVLVGPNDPQLFTPPGARAVSRTGHCAYQPCGGRPKCIGTSFQYVCMTKIEPPQVVDAVLADPAK